MYKIAYPYLLCNHLVITHSCGLFTNEPKTEDQWICANITIQSTKHLLLTQKAAETTLISNMIS